MTPLISSSSRASTALAHRVELLVDRLEFFADAVDVA
jgi:hypothetical protein